MSGYVGLVAADGVTPIGTASNPIQTALPTGASASQVQGAGANGSAKVGNAVRAAGTDGTNTYDLLTDANGRLLIIPQWYNANQAAYQSLQASDVGLYVRGANPGTEISAATSTTGTTETTLFAAAGAGLKNYISTLSLANSSATATLVTIRSGTGGTIIGYAYAPAGVTTTVEFKNPIQSAANTLISYQAGTGVSTLYITATGFKGL